MRPLPRLHAITDPSVLALEDLGVRAAALAAAGPAVALHARGRELSGAALAGLATRFLALARPPEAAVFVNGRPDVARALDAQGVQLGEQDLTPADARQVLGGAWRGWLGCSVHTGPEARAATDAGADFLLVGAVYETATHPWQSPAGLALVQEASRLGPPVIAIGGITPGRAAEVRQAGAYGVAAVRAAWHTADPYAAALALLEPWLDE